MRGMTPPVMLVVEEAIVQLYRRLTDDPETAKE